MTGSGRGDRETAAVEEATCECGHPVAEHVASGWGPHSVCVWKLDDESAGWYGVCPCVRHGDDFEERFVSVRPDNEEAKPDA